MTAAANDLRRRQLRLGLALGAGWLLLVAIFVILFRTHGLPKDPQEWRRLQQLRAAGSDAPVPGKPMP